MWPAVNVMFTASYQYAFALIRSQSACMLNIKPVLLSDTSLCSNQEKHLFGFIISCERNGENTRKH